MTKIFGVSRPLIVPACICLALCLQSCGGSSNTPAGKANSDSHAAAQSHSSSTTRTASSIVQATSTTVAAEARRRVARVAAMNSISGCLREHGVNVPPQKPSVGFSTKGLNTASPAYKHAYPGCLRIAIAVYRARLRGQL